jgi:hypothetical protein
MSKVNQQKTKVIKVAVTSPKPVVAKPVLAKPVVAKPAMPKPSIKKEVKKITAPKVEKVAKPVKEKTPKLKMVRDSFTMPKNEYTQFSVLKDRLIKFGQPVKKSELLRAGMMQLAEMTDTALKAAMSKVPTIKTGRPNK